MDASSFPPVQQRLMEFIRRRFQLGYNHYNVQKLIGDASSRQYFRLVFENEGSYVLAAYPEPFQLETFTYQEVYDIFRMVGLPVPEIIVADGELGIVLQEDLGDESVQKRLRHSTQEEYCRLMCRAIDLLILIQTQATKVVPSNTEAARLAFDKEKLSWELAFFRRYYGNYRNLPLPEDKGLIADSGRLAEELASYPRFLCHRDYHVRNLMVKNDQVYIIDFQDARQGPALYDLVSLLKDSIQLTPEQVEWYVGYYINQSRTANSPALLEARALRRQFDLMTIQRLLKALGTYGYQITERANFIYEQYVPGSLHRASLALQSLQEFPYIQSLVADEVTRLVTDKDR
ncbi:MAG: aminoglycoside phosphotransferase family protein [Acidobacteriota bacterium]